jgi:chromosome segregation protein
VRRLRTVVLEGFKTFAQPTIVDFAGGMTAIVGPNGCGKSNLIDAIAWAVGSRSWKSLRGGDMEDVIYHGGEGVPPATRAMVRLVFENPDRALPLDLEDVEVTREIDRQTGTKAYINRVEARVKDLQQLLAGTGLVGGFSLVRQGMVDRLILSPPEELGRWIEEAADIAGFRSKRKEALDRLEKVRHNLAQAEQHIEALRRERKKVKERAEKARERNTLAERASLLSRQVTILERQAIENEIASLESRKGMLPQESAELERRRAEQLALRTRIEHYLAGEERPAHPETPPSPLPSREAVREKAGRLESAGGFAVDLGRLLAQEGPPVWPKVKKGIRRTIEILRELEEDEARAGGKPPSADEETRALVAHLREVNQEIDTLDQRRTQIARDLALIAEERGRLEERLVHLGTPLPPATPAPEGVSVSHLRKDLERLEKELSKIGPVDETAQALEEDLSRKIEIAKASLKDLREAQSQLLRFLEEQDVLAAQVFRHTLLEVEKRFEKHFATLFGGGQVRLRLAAPPADGEGEGEEIPDLQNENHSPSIIIYVKLPGKKESALMLLSGGERSLCGIALILALAAGDPEKEKGGRLLIFDEVDAALDQANAVRFARLVAELSKTHQILCVTHCAPTMREASRLVGITTGSAPGMTAVFGMAMPNTDAVATATRATVEKTRS